LGSDPIKTGHGMWQFSTAVSPPLHNLLKMGLKIKLRQTNCRENAQVIYILFS